MHQLDTMPSTPNSTNSVEATTVLLQAELPQLEEHQQAMQKELTAVSERLESVRGVPTALSALSATALLQTCTAEANAHVDAGSEATSIDPAAGTAPTAAEIAPADDPAVAQQKTPTPRKARNTSASTKN